MNVLLFLGPGFLVYRQAGGWPVKVLKLTSWKHQKESVGLPALLEKMVIASISDPIASFPKIPRLLTRFSSYLTKSWNPRPGGSNFTIKANTSIIPCRRTIFFFK